MTLNELALMAAIIGGLITAIRAVPGTAKTLGAGYLWLKRKIFLIHEWKEIEAMKARQPEDGE